MNFAMEAPLKLEPGGVYVIELDYLFKTQEEAERYRSELDAFGQKYGVSFIVMERGAKIARTKVVDVTSLEDSQKTRERKSTT